MAVVVVLCVLLGAGVKKLQQSGWCLFHENGMICRCVVGPTGPGAGVLLARQPHSELVQLLSRQYLHKVCPL
jgi:hypothetical protein